MGEHAIPSFKSLYLRREIQYRSGRTPGSASLAQGWFAWLCSFLWNSYTFGYGLNDNESLPYQVGVQTAGLYRTYNFAFNGYSPAQMLAAIEDGMVRRVVDTAPKYVYYAAIPDQVWRVASRKAWIKHQPRYILEADGTVRFAGFFPDPTPLALQLGFGKRIADQLGKSAMWRALNLREAAITRDDIDLYLAIVRRSRDLLAVQFPGVTFRVLMWPGHTEAQRSTSVVLGQDLQQMGISVDLVVNILPGYTRNETPFVLSSRDPHPNAVANRLLAQFLVNELSH